MSDTPIRKRHVIRPSGAYKLLVTLYDAYSPSLIEVGDGGGVRGHLALRSIRSLARLLGTDSKTVNKWLLWLSEHGYLETIQWSEDRRRVKLKLRRPRNI